MTNALDEPFDNPLAPPAIHWQTNTPSPGFVTVTALTEHARVFLDEMVENDKATEEPLNGAWNPTTGILILHDGEADYVWQHLGPNFEHTLRADDEYQPPAMPT